MALCQKDPHFKGPIWAFFLPANKTSNMEASHFTSIGRVLFIGLFIDGWFKSHRCHLVFDRELSRAGPTNCFSGGIKKPVSPLGKFWVISPWSCCNLIKHMNIVNNHEINIVQNFNYFYRELKLMWS